RHHPHGRQLQRGAVQALPARERYRPPRHGRRTIRMNAASPTGNSRGPEARPMKSTTVAAWLLLCGGVLTSACSSNGGGGTGGSLPQGCVPGQSVACTGPGSCAGYQVCAPDGKSFGACMCGGSSGSGTGGAASGSSSGTSSTSSTSSSGTGG